MLAEYSLEGKTALVTGAGRGIGRAIALVLAEAEADVAVAARTVSEIEETAAMIRALGRRSLAVQTDVSRSKQVDALIAEVVTDWGHLDILVNNAGQYIKVPTGPLPGPTLAPPTTTRLAETGLSDEEWHQMLNTNLSSAMYGCRAVAPHMLERGYGKIINISSKNATHAAALNAAYNPAKAGLNMLTRVLALEWATHGIRVNAIGPGTFPAGTGDFALSDPATFKRAEQEVPIGRLGDLRELGLLAVYLASPASDYMTGQVVYLDGGVTAS
jgi:NAD(P)-dependent dehydrogenase (short-subunit alcohol dehydrogenase family)